jgi:hypothetical protein
MRYRPDKGLKTLYRTTLVIRQNPMRKITRASAPEETPAVQRATAYPVFQIR